MNNFDIRVGFEIDDMRMTKFRQLLESIEKFGFKIFSGLSTNHNAFSCHLKDFRNFPQNILKSYEIETPFVAIDFRSSCYFWFYSLDEVSKFDFDVFDSFTALFNLSDDGRFVVWCKTPTMNRYLKRLKNLREHFNGEQRQGVYHNVDQSNRFVKKFKYMYGSTSEVIPTAIRDSFDPIQMAQMLIEAGKES
ncbi:MAG: hypothetical protein UT24_C0011G0006 [Candidatus Woesebacteria bacterium GW2011_GWB1_39_12]|uniref:Uncharacterized protein n=1 Tax=Candidatus Woesebacteria bacterium GW2011_GWB1_39_12 TaxID=1618574 RepID=A0A0G0MBG2_9BACT|nr:MAG: hypothetical protein UT24_C0011G0006 [Candidatus Woesebacteria bacterium GW2011_GWB1_39_12]